MPLKVRTCRSASIPSIPGSITSSSTRSGASRRTRRTASSPEACVKPARKARPAPSRKLHGGAAGCITSPRHAQSAGTDEERTVMKLTRKHVVTGLAAAGLMAGALTAGGGRTWGNARLIKSDQGTSPVFEVTQFFNDKESVTADPKTAGTAYVVWDRLKAPSHSPDADLRAHAFRGPAWFSKTTDGGKTWTGTRAIFDPGQNSQTIGNQVVVNRQTGVLYDFFEQFQTTGSPKFTPRGLSVSFISSSDGGSTWSKPTVVSNQQTVDDFAPNTGALLRTGAGLPSVAIDASNGDLYVVWEDARFTSGTVNQAVISTSTNGGAHWSGPAVVSNPNSKPAFTPTVAVNSGGTVAVTYYDFRNPDGSTVGQPTDYWFTASTDHGASFGDETRITPTSFDILNAPNAGGLFLGDYEGLDVNGTAFVPFFVKTNDEDKSNRTDVFTTSI